LAILGLSWASTGGSGPLLGAAVCDPGPLLEPMLAVLGRSWALCWRSWAALGAYVGGLGPKNAKNMATLNMCLFLERGRDLWPWGQSWAALGSYLGGLGSLLGPMLAVLGRSWALCWRSWAALGAYVGGPGPLLGPMLAVLAALGVSVGGPGGSKAEKWPWPEREGDLGRLAGWQAGRAGIAPSDPSDGMDPNRTKPSTHFFYRYVY
jgi:hypothetical protein